MDITKVCRLEKETKLKVVKDFSWSLKPLFIWLNCIVIDLNYSLSDRRIQLVRSISFTIFGFLLFSINFASQILSVYFRYEKLEPLSSSLTFHTNRIIDAINYGVRNIGVHASLLLVVHFYWKKLWKSAKKIEIFIPRYSHVYVRFRMLALAGLFYILMMEIFVLRTGYAALISIQDQLLKQTVVMISWLTLVFSYSSLILYACLGQIASAGFQAIGHQVRDYKKSQFIKGFTISNEQIKEWERNYKIVSTYLHNLNRSFGPILFFEISSVFLGFVVNSFYIVYGIVKYLPLSIYSVAAVALFKHSISLLVICRVAENIRREASDILRQLSKLNFDHPILDQKLNSLAAQVHRLHPEINAIGLFSVGMNLIPTLIGTTLTYLIILFQFQSMEKNLMEH